MIQKLPRSQEITQTTTATTLMDQKQYVFPRLGGGGNINNIHKQLYFFKLNHALVVESVTVILNRMRMIPIYVGFYVSSVLLDALCHCKLDCKASSGEGHTVNYPLNK